MPLFEFHPNSVHENITSFLKVPWLIWKQSCLSLTVCPAFHWKRGRYNYHSPFSKCIFPKWQLSYFGAGLEISPWEADVFKWPRIPQGPSGNWPSDGPWWWRWLLCVGSSPWPSLCPGLSFFAIWVEPGVGFCLLNFIPLKHLRGILFFPLLPE